MDRFDMQTKIWQEHKSSGNNILSRGIASGIGEGEVEGLDIVHTRIAYWGFTKEEFHPIIPYFEFQVEAYYNVGLTDEARLAHVMVFEDDGIRLVKDEIWSKAFFHQLGKLFDVRNIGLEGLVEADADIELVSPEAGFRLYAGSEIAGRLVAELPVEHPDAEEIIHTYLKMIDEGMMRHGGYLPFLRSKRVPRRLMSELSGYVIEKGLEHTRI